MFCYGIEGKHWEASGEHGLVSLPDSTNYAYDSNCNWGVRNDAYWRVVEGGIPNFEEMNEVWKENARSGSYQTFVFDDSNVKNEIAAITEIFNTDYKLLGLGFTDDPAGDIATVSYTHLDVYKRQVHHLSNLIVARRLQPHGDVAFFHSLHRAGKLRYPL